MQYPRTTLVFILLLVSHLLSGQGEVKIRNSKDFSFELQQNTIKGFKVKQQTGSFKIEAKSFKNRDFSEIRTKHLMKTFRKGYPNLPVISKLIEIPIGVDFKVNILSYDIKEVDLKNKGIDTKLAPAQPSKSKSNDGEDDEFYFNEEVYKTNKFFGDELVKVEDRGIMRNIRFGRLQISPLEYNPVENKLRIYTNIEFEVKFSGDSGSNTKKIYRKYASPYFEEVHSKAFNYKSSDTLGGLIDNSPITYVIVSDRMFEEQLQPFIEWKELKGYNVIEAYTDSIGSTTSEIKSYLEDLYNNPESTPPSFVLFVGDVEQIPAWEGNTDSHVTDFYYCEYTGDNLPDVFYGRFSAQDSSQLQPQIDKTLEYEKFEMAEPEYLKEALLVAGDDESWEDIHGNGSMWYADNYYFNRDNEINSHLFLQDPPNGNSAVHDSIIKNVNAGVGYANYTAHCSSSGWAEPSFSVSDVNALDNEAKYGLWVGNCCLSVKFDESESFGEAALRAKNSGAIGDIGGSNNTYWDEDYWWGVGNIATPVEEPTYEETGRGAYDGMFHTKSKEVDEPSSWYVSQGQIPFCGNLAVEASTSSLKEYYWEIYHLMGDPSLMPYLGMPDPLTVSITPSELLVGMNSLTVNTEPHVYVALSFEDELLDAKRTGASGEVILNFDPIPNAGKAHLVITGQNKQPYIDTLTVNQTEEPYVILDSLSLIDTSGNKNGKADYGEIINLDIVLRNISDSSEAFNVFDSLYQQSQYISFTDSMQDYGNIEPGKDSLIPGAFSFKVNDSVPDQQRLSFAMHVTGNDSSGNEYTWKSDFSITLNAPKLEIGEITVVDTSSGDGNGLLDPGETADLTVEVTNIGHSDISGVEGTLNTSSSELKINNGSDGFYSIAADSTEYLAFNVTAEDSTIVGTEVPLEIDVTGKNNMYKEKVTKQFVIGKIPEYIINEEDTVYTCNGLFYDSGGPDRVYSNNESNVITFEPATSGNAIKAEFLSFDVEEEYDWLKVYDGVGVSSELLGSYDNANLPSVFLADNKSGALTFEFYSDVSETKKGWEADISCVEVNKVVFKITDDTEPIENAEITCDGDTIITDKKGEAALFLKDSIYDYTVSRTGYKETSGSINVTSEMTENITLEPLLLDVSFNIYPDEDKNKSVDAEVTLKDTSLSAVNGTCTFENIEYSGYISYEVKAGDCHPVSDSVLLTSDTTLNIGMSCNTYQITIHTEDDAGNSLNDVEVELANINKQTNVEGNVDFEGLYRGLYECMAVKEGYKSDTLEILVEMDSTYVISMTSETSIGVLLSEDFNIYPNPADEQLVIESPKEKKIYYYLIDITGKILLNGSLFNSVNTIDISSYKPGIYFIRVRTNEKFVQDKIIIE